MVLGRHLLKHSSTNPHWLWTLCVSHEWACQDAVIILLASHRLWSSRTVNTAIIYLEMSLAILWTSAVWLVRPNRRYSIHALRSQISDELPRKLLDKGLSKVHRPNSASERGVAGTWSNNAPSSHSWTRRSWTWRSWCHLAAPLQLTNPALRDPQARCSDRWHLTFLILLYCILGDWEIESNHPKTSKEATVRRIACWQKQTRCSLTGSRRICSCLGSWKSVWPSAWGSPHLD